MFVAAFVAREFQKSHKQLSAHLDFRLTVALPCFALAARGTDLRFGGAEAREAAAREPPDRAVAVLGSATCGVTGCGAAFTRTGAGGASLLRNTIVKRTWSPTAW